MNKSSLYNIVEHVSNNMPKKYLEKINKNNYQLIDTISENLLTYEELIKIKKLEEGRQYNCLIPVSKCHSDYIYNRTKELSWSNIYSSLDKRKGFSYREANTLYGFIRPDETIVITQGNHRASMAYLVLGPDALIPVQLYVHYKNIDIDEIITTESNNYNTDCNYRTKQTPTQSFKGAYYAGEEWAIKLYEICKPHCISIGETHYDAKGNLTFKPRKKFSSFKYFEHKLKRDIGVMNTSSDVINMFAQTQYQEYPITHECLEVLSLYNNATDISGNLYKGLFEFRKQFNNVLNDVFKKNKEASFANFIKYIFTERHTNVYENKLTTQEDIIKGCGTQKSDSWFCSRFIQYFNEYCIKNRYKLPLGRKYAIDTSVDEANDFIDYAINEQKTTLSQLNLPYSIPKRSK